MAIILPCQGRDGSSILLARSMKLQVRCMKRDNYKKSWIKFVIGWVVVFAVRLVPFRPPNVEPIMATLMPFSKRYGYIGSFMFASLSIALFDFAVGKVGMWTLITAVAYGILGVGSYAFFKKRAASAKNFVVYGVVGTMLYDAATGLSVGPLFFDQPFMEALVGQVPFTLAHLAGTVVLSLLVSPALYKWVVMNRRLETDVVFSRFLRTKSVS